MTVTPELLREIPMLSDLDGAELEAIAGCFTLKSLPIGETLYIQGDAASGACFLLEGRMEALKSLPGGGAAQVGLIEPGRMIGETALLAGEVRSATVRAITPATILEVSYNFFHAALEQISVPAHKILRRAIHTLTEQLEELQVRILGQWDCEAYGEPRPTAVADAGSGKEYAERSFSFDYRSFLPILPSFAGYTSDEIDRLLEYVKALEVASGEFLYRERAPAGSCHIIVRGAIETSVTRDRKYQLSILGPGRLCGVDSLLIGNGRSHDARVRSTALVLRLDGFAFESFYRGETPGCLRFQRMVSANQLRARKTADNLLSTLVSQDHISRGPEMLGAISGLTV